MPPTDPDKGARGRWRWPPLGKELLDIGVVRMEQRRQANPTPTLPSASVKRRRAWESGSLSPQTGRDSEDRTIKRIQSRISILPFFIVDMLIAIARAFQTPIRRIPMPLRLAAGLLSMLFCLFAAMHAIAARESVFVTADARFYLGIARGDYSQVMQPFALRQLGAIFAAVLGHLLHASVEEGFVLEGMLSLVTLLMVIYSVLLRSSAPGWLLAAIAFLPFWPMLMKEMVLPDLWYSALLALLLLLLKNEKMLAASLMMFPLMLSRESTSLTLVCLLAAGWQWLRWRDRWVAAISALAGAIVVKHLALHAQPNLEHLPETIYMLAKVPWNFSNNVLGLVPWSNVNQSFCSVPIWKLPVQFGPVQAIGICGFSSLGWMKITSTMLNEFGLLPLLMAFLWWQRRKTRESVAQSNLLLRFTLFYGVASLALAPVLGTWISRLVGYAWPMYLVALPLQFRPVSRSVLLSKRALAGTGFFCLHLIAVWFSIYQAIRWTWTIQVTVEFGLWTVGYFLLRFWLGAGKEEPGSGDGVGAGIPPANSAALATGR